MSGLNLVAVQDIISAHIKAEFPGYSVYDDDVIDDDFILKQNNNTKPYIVLNWGSLRRTGTGGSFVGVRYDEYYSTVDVGIVAPTPRQARLSHNVIMDRLIGWKPTNGGAMTPEGGTDVWAIPNKLGKPNVYVASSRLSYAVNSDNVGSYIQP